MTLILTHSDITPLLDRNEIRQAVEAAHAGLAAGEFNNPAPRVLPLLANGSALPMAASARDRVAVKLLCDMPFSRPSQRSTIVVTDAATGECVAVLDGRAITAIRTAAASAVATDHLARPAASTLGLVGAGNLAIEHAHAIAAVRNIERIVIWSRSTRTLDTFRSATESLGIPVQSAPSVEAVLGAAEIVCTLTPSRDPIVCGSWLHPGHHINAVGAPPRPDHREIDSLGMSRARIVVDSHSTAMSKSGGVLLAIAEGAITADDVRTELGHVIAGTEQARTTPDDITIYESVGIALQDLVTANLVIEHAKSLGAGTFVDLTPDADATFRCESWRAHSGRYPLSISQLFVAVRKNSGGTLIRQFSIFEHSLKQRNGAMKGKFIGGAAIAISSAFMLAPAVANATPATTVPAAPGVTEVELNTLTEPTASIAYWTCMIGRAINSSYIPNVTTPPCVYGQQT